MDWTDTALHGDEPTTAAQRRALYRLGLSRHFVHKLVQTKAQASAIIGRLLVLHGELRDETKEGYEPFSIDLVGSVNC